jgi:two-component system sensor histidine kinase CreC
MRRGPSIALLLLGANLFVLSLPLLLLLVWRAYDLYLLRQTERQLINQSVVVAEAFREAWWQETGITNDDPRPPDRNADRFVAIEPVLDVLSETIQPYHAVELREDQPDPNTPEHRAGARIEGLLQRAQIFNLSGVRVLDPKACVVASTGAQSDHCIVPPSEVARALGGQYAAVARRRAAPKPLPPLGDIRSRGRLQVFTALPVFSDGRVIAVVTATRTGLDALSSLWQIRRGLLVAVGLGVLLIAAVSLLFARAIVGPMQAITNKARAVAAGDTQSDFVVRGFTPAEIRSLSEALDIMTKKLRAQAEYVAEFATTVSHELKTPIAAIRGAGELLTDFESMDRAQRQRFLGNILLDTERMDRLVTRLIALAKIESAALLPSARLRVVEFCRHLLARHGATVQLVVKDPPREIEIAEEHLASAIGNLVDNAVRHGRGRPVVVTLGSAAGRLEVQVADRGEGISPGNQARVWDRFFTTERDRGGTGLGLSIVQAIVRARNGEVGFETSAEGTRFRMVL